MMTIRSTSAFLIMILIISIAILAIPSTTIAVGLFLLESDGVIRIGSAHIMVGTRGYTRPTGSTTPVSTLLDFIIRIPAFISDPILAISTAILVAAISNGGISVDGTS